MIGLFAGVALIGAALWYWKWELRHCSWYRWASACWWVLAGVMALAAFHALTREVVLIGTVIFLICVLCLFCLRQTYRFSRLYGLACRIALSAFCVGCLLAVFIR